MKIICIGRNYVDHARELNNEVPADPVFFMKPDTAILQQDRAFYIPDFSNDIHYEVELVIKICKEGKNIAEEFASRYYDQITVGIDFTARDLQQKQKEKGLPWEPAKAFDGSAAVGEFVPLSSLPAIANIRFSLSQNNEVRQMGESNLMIFSFNKIIAYVSQYITLRKGDLIYTGTPKGVGRITHGDELICSLDNMPLLKVKIR
jgi:2-keto-4-pentenoate hydratase/2-oxohepta-3-ene-1,7-dioic acid hydratase in catechol pathway